MRFALPLPPRSNQRRRPSRTFKPAWGNPCCGSELERRLPPSTLVDVTHDTSLDSGYGDYYSFNPADPSDPTLVLYFYGETHDSAEVVTASMGPTLPISIEVVNKQYFDGYVIHPDDGVLFTTTAADRIDQDWLLTFYDSDTNLPPADPVTVSGVFSISLGLGGGIRTVDMGLFFYFHNNFADVSVQGLTINASWSDGGNSYSYTGDVRAGLAFEYSGEVSSTFETTATSILGPEMFVYEGGPDEAHATLEWSFSMNASA